MFLFSHKHSTNLIINSNMIYSRLFTVQYNTNNSNTIIYIYLINTSLAIKIKFKVS
jgi:hypothetical protein